MKAIYQYLDYRQFLLDLIAAKREKTATFSLEQLCRRAGNITKSHLSLILSGKRNLTEAKAEGLYRALDLTDAEIRYFRHLVSFNQAKNSTEREIHLNAMFVETKRRRGDSDSINSLRILNSWHCVAIRELARLPDFNPNPRAIAARLRGLLTAPEAKK